MTVVPIKSLPLGFRFHPTDEELVNHYLKGKINGRLRSEIEVIPEIDVCKCEPWDLPQKSLIHSDDHEWFFFAPIDRKYPNGHRSNRATCAGYWKATGKDRVIRSRSAPPTGIIGMKKTLVFHCGRAPKGVRTCWIMHEYRTTEPEFECGEQGGYVIYRLFKKPEEKPNDDEEAMNGGYPQTASKFSPIDVQPTAAEIEDPPAFQPLNQTFKEQSAVKLRRIAEKADSRGSTATPENSVSNALTTSEVANNEAEVDPLTNVLEQFCDPYDEQSINKSFPNVSSPIPYTDWSVYKSGYEPDHIDEVLNLMLASQDKYDEDVAPHNFTIESSSNFMNGQNEGFERDYASNSKINWGLAIKEGDIHIHPEKESFPASLPDFSSFHEDSPTGLQQEHFQDVFDRSSHITSLVDDNLDGRNLVDDNKSANIFQNHFKPTIHGAAMRRLRLQKKVRAGLPSCQEPESSGSNGDQIGKNTPRKTREEYQLLTGEENLAKLNKFSSVVAYMGRVALLFVFTSLCFFLWRYITLHVI